MFRDALGRIRSRKVVLREIVGRDEARRRLRVPPGLPNAGRFLPKGTPGVLAWVPMRLAQLALEGGEYRFVRVHVGGVEIRATPVPSVVLRAIAGRAVKRQILRPGEKVTRPLDAQISDMVIALEEADYEQLVDYISDLELQDVRIEPEDWS